MRLRRATRRCLRYAQTCFAAALALLFDLENNFGSSKAAAKQVLPQAKQRRAARAESPHLRYLRFFQMCPKTGKHTIIQFRRKAIP